MNEKKTHKCNEFRSFWSYFGQGIATALVILSITFGIGGCSALVNHGWPNQHHTETGNK